VEEIQRRVISAVQSLLVHWDDVADGDSSGVCETIVKVNDENRGKRGDGMQGNDSSSSHQAGSVTTIQVGSRKRGRGTTLKVHDLTEDAAERAYTMFLHPSLR
jgi:hypothetical protein